MTLLAMSLALAGCTPTVKEAADNSNTEAQTAESSEAKDSANTEDEASDKDSKESDSDKEEAGDDTAKEEDSEPIELSDKLAAFIDGKETISFKYYMKNVCDEETYPYYVDDTIQRIPADKDYTLPELIDTLDEIIHNEDYGYFIDGDNDTISMEYAAIDCGADGIPELALKIQGPFIESSSTMTLIIKELEGKLQVIFSYAEWSRSSTDINKYGYITSGGSNGASNHGYDVSILDADGGYTFGYYEEEESDVRGYITDNTYDPEKDGVICMYSLRIGEYSEDNDKEYYTYRVYDYDNFEEKDIPDLYTDSIYKKIMDTVPDKEFLTAEEFDAIESDRLKEIGATDKIRHGGQVSYNPVDVDAMRGDSDTASKTTEKKEKSDDSKAVSVQDEIDGIEKKSDEYDGLDYASMDQSSINNAILECYTLWDDELNSIWSKIMAEIDPKDKNALLNEQRTWIKEKEKAMDDATKEASGGSLAAQLKYGEGKVQTRKRVYYLASKLAKLRGESFAIPADAK